MNDATKICSRCHTEQPLTNFSPKKKAAGGRNPICRSCINAEYRAKNPPKENQMAIRPRNYAVKRVQTEHGTVRVQFGDSVRMQPPGEHRARMVPGVQSSLSLGE